MKLAILFPLWFVLGSLFFVKGLTGWGLVMMYALYGVMGYCTIRESRLSLKRLKERHLRQLREMEARHVAERAALQSYKEEVLKAIGDAKAPSRNVWP